MCGCFFFFSFFLSLSLCCFSLHVCMSWANRWGPRWPEPHWQHIGLKVTLINEWKTVTRETLDWNIRIRQSMFVSLCLMKHFSTLWLVNYNNGPKTKKTFWKISWLSLSTVQLSTILVIFFVTLYTMKNIILTENVNNESKINTYSPHGTKSNHSPGGLTFTLFTYAAL